MKKREKKEEMERKTKIRKRTEGGLIRGRKEKTKRNKERKRKQRKKREKTRKNVG